MDYTCSNCFALLPHFLHICVVLFIQPNCTHLFFRLLPDLLDLFHFFFFSGMAYALHQAGFVAGLFLLGLVALVTDYSLILMVRSAHLSNSFSYQSLMEAAFGASGFYLLTFLQFVYPFIGNL